MTYEIEGQRVELSSETVFFLKKGSRRVRLATNSRANFFVFNFSCDTPISLPTVLRNATHGAVYSLLSAYDAIKRDTPFDNMEEIEHLLGCLLTVLDHRAHTRAYSHLTQKILDYLHQNFKKSITLEEVGRVAFFSPVYCDAVFKKDTGSTIIDYVLTLRIEESKKLLLKGNSDIKEIAESIGFHSGNYYSRVFKKRVGCAPSAYRAHSKGIIS
jgi:YesN/AraC family two-component response regulator